MKVTLTYLESPGQYSTGHDAFLGKWRVGWVGWDSLSNRDDPRKYKATCSLSGIKATLGNYETEEAARAQLEKAVEVWLKGTGLTFSEGEK